MCPLNTLQCKFLKIYGQNINIIIFIVFPKRILIFVSLEAYTYHVVSACLLFLLTLQIQDSFMQRYVDLSFIPYLLKSTSYNGCHC